MPRLVYLTEDEYLTEAGIGPQQPAPFSADLDGPWVQTARGVRIGSRIGKCAYAVYQSDNTKLGLVCATTYAAQSSCPRPGDGVSPRPCPLYRNGCYGEHDKPSYAMREINESRCSSHEVAREEAAAITELASLPTCPRPLRLHTVGDCPTPEDAGVVAAAVQWYMRTTGAPAWAYSHSWNVPRSTWGRVSILLSTHSLEECAEALRRCYAPALLVAEYVQSSRYHLARDLWGVPCPAIVAVGHAVTCPMCQLCWNDGERLRRREVILFAPHGGGQRKARQSACDSACSGSGRAA